METQEIIEMCERLCRKYRRMDISEDLISEAVVAIYERLDVKPDDYPASLYRVANKSMHDYINIKCKPVYIPKTRTAESVSKGVNYASGSYSEKGKKALEEALNSTYVSSEASYTICTEDCSESYEKKDFITKAMGVLTEKERDVIYKLYFLDLSQAEVSKIYNVSQVAVHYWENNALSKMSSL